MNGKEIQKKVANYLQIGNEWQKIVMKVYATLQNLQQKEKA